MIILVKMKVKEFLWKYVKRTFTHGHNDMAEPLPINKRCWSLLTKKTPGCKLNGVFPA